MRARHLLFATALVTAGCTKEKVEEAPPPDSGPHRTDLELPWSGGLPMLTNIAPPPPGYDEARDLYRTATVAIAHGDLTGGAERILEVSARLKTLPAEHPHRRTYDAARCLLYQNAAAVWVAADRSAVAKERLGALVKEDPACRASIDYELQKL